MRNLFVLHTQYNLLLATGLCRTCLVKDQNALILFKDFDFTKIHMDCIKDIYEETLILQGNYPKKEHSYREKNKRIFEQNESIYNFVQIHEKYDQIFIIEDMCIQEMCTMKYVYQKNRRVIMNWLEDGAIAYFDNNTISGGMGATPIRRFIRKEYFCLKYNLFGVYYLGNCMGSNPLLKNVYVLFPKCVRQELSNKMICEISQESFRKGMELLFKGDSISFEDESVILILDRLDVYANLLQNVDAYIKKIIFEARREKKRVYYKYHPRETKYLKSLDSAEELNRSLALEAYLTNSTTDKLTIVGFKSTALQTAKKMGYETISYIKQLEPDNTQISDFYESIGIICK